MLYEKRVELAEEKLRKMWAENAKQNDNGCLVLHFRMKNGTWISTWNVREAGGKPVRYYRDGRSGLVCRVGTMRGLAMALLDNFK